ncbi:MAG: methyltransferase, TIGR04325 family [Chlorobium sp.]|nr:methyltransferase, TIGR04325 family [Chlorobium sp.]
MVNFSELKEYIPPILARELSGLFYGWRGNYPSWQMAKSKCTGYGHDDILKKVRTAALEVSSGNAVFERDSMLFDTIEYSFPVLSAILWIAHQNLGEINLIDFGGSLGSSYFQNRYFLQALNKVCWSVVEQPHFVRTGKEELANDQLHFYESIEECLQERQADTILLSSVIQYLEKPYELIDNIIKNGFKYVIIDRTPFLLNGNDRITIQKVHPLIYKATYPCWFFNKEKFVSHFSGKYELITEFDSLDKASIRSDFKGFIFKHRID